MNFKRSFILFFFLILHFCSHAQETIIPALSSDYIDKLVDSAKKNYPRIKFFQNRVNAADANISKTQMGVFNALTVSYVYQPGTTTIDPVNPKTSYFKGFQAGVFVNFGALLAQPHAVKQARDEKLIAQNEQEEYFLTLATEVKKRYFLYVQRLAELRLQIRALQDVESALKDVKYKFERGEETLDTYSKVVVQYTDHQQTKVQAEANVFIARADVEELIGTKLENIK